MMKISAPQTAAEIAAARLYPMSARRNRTRTGFVFADEASALR